ncbi:SMU1112c/YaeR family gloxylase I-like metalloprotein [Clostridium perfringens]|uniref:Glyoxalase family protein n=1 Tax=Clostridium perfringens E str. JGS1987 TaxID=451755 RepID=B1BNL2_CLOPF|nr:VOC family protein [Clostridium perfringens]EDT16750.1 glyoxalase family protein [Clostridium perfringens E str. JGS1987]EJT6558989.1 VOC family protein [Clostridium perfringens]ELC8459868.1 VOC family protein [Clostridium perfringens]MCX0376058.1 VOC family protein [Clostridium perfringens]MDK0655179.1 VOC family protein [Clostridium perfringens]
MNLKKIHHVAIIASDYKKSKDFYVNLLGLKIIREVYREERDSYKLDLEIGDSQIELFSFKNPPKRQSYPEACGLRHLAFEVENIEEQVRELKEKGIKVEEIRIDEFTGRKFTFFSDPDDLPIELYEIACN